MDKKTISLYSFSDLVNLKETLNPESQELFNSGSLVSSLEQALQKNDKSDLKALINQTDEVLLSQTLIKIKSS